MAAIRPIPQQSIIECIPPASEIAELRIANKDLNFIDKKIGETMKKLNYNL